MAASSSGNLDRALETSELEPGGLPSPAALDASGCRTRAQDIKEGSKVGRRRPTSRVSLAGTPKRAESLQDGETVAKRFRKEGDTAIQ